MAGLITNYFEGRLPFDIAPGSILGLIVSAILQAPTPPKEHPRTVAFVPSL